MPFAEIVFNLPLDHCYTYHIPQEIARPLPGMRVLVPFGKRTITGIVVSVNDKTKLSAPKDIIDVLDDQPLLSLEMMAFTKWISEYYLSTYGQALYLALPKGIDIEDKERLHLLIEDPHIELKGRQRDLYLLIGEQSGNTTAYYRKKYGHQSFYHFVSALEKKGLIRKEKYRQGVRVQQLTRKFVEVSADYDADKNKTEAFLRYINNRPEVDTYLSDHPGQAISLKIFLLETNMASATLKKIVSYGLCQIVEQKVERKPEIAFQEPAKEIILTDEQEKAASAIRAQIAKETFSVFMLHGVTGSGKTQVYIEAVKETLSREKNAIVLIPEIALTPQTVARFTQVSEGQIAVFHSKMSTGERFDAWMACYRKEVRVVIGPRSALFSPLSNIGLIVVDEEHETTYKQTDTAPRYHARDAAIYWSRMNKAVVILGSATPALESYYNARKGKYQHLEILNRIDNIRMPDVHIVDMKKKRARVNGEMTLFSEILLEKINDRLARKEQIILLQNRRGYSSFMQCKACGFIPLCPNCDISLTYHSYNEQLQCHLCGHKLAAYRDCPACGDKQLAYKGVGTQRIQDELLKLLPGVRLIRMDQDTTRGKNKHDKILQAFGAKEADILLGTQMIAKGLDFENVTLVGVISADVGLAIPDYRSAERVFQLLTQVAGRSGRGHKEGEVVVQSYLSSHYAIQFAQQHDFTGFYMQEMQHRSDYSYPPFLKTIQVLVSALKMSDAINLARSLAGSVKRRANNYCQVIGPAPGILPRVNNYFRWQLFIKINAKTDPSGNKTRTILRQILEPQLSKRSPDLRVSVDVDPVLLS